MLSAEHGRRLALALARLPDEVAADAAQSVATLGELDARVRNAIVTPACTPATPTTISQRLSNASKDQFVWQNWLIEKFLNPVLTIE